MRPMRQPEAFRRRGELVAADPPQGRMVRHGRREADRFYPSSLPKLCSDFIAAHGQTAHLPLGRELYWTCAQSLACDIHRNENATAQPVGIAYGGSSRWYCLFKLALGPVGPACNAPGREGAWLATNASPSSETGPVEGRTAPLTQVSPAVPRWWDCQPDWQSKESGYQHPATAGYLIIAYIPDNVPYAIPVGIIVPRR